jgi:hypothetical protein
MYIQYCKYPQHVGAHRQPLLGLAAASSQRKTRLFKGVCSAARQGRRFRVNLSILQQVESYVGSHSVIVCPACDLLIERKVAALRRHAHCPRCHQHLWALCLSSFPVDGLTITGFLLLPSPFRTLDLLRLAGVNSDPTCSKAF